MRRYVLLILLALSQIACAQHASPTAIRNDLTWLASDAREGRALGTPGCDQAAQFIEDRLRGLNLLPLPALKGYQQHFDIDSGVKLDPACALSIGVNALKFEEDFRPHVSSSSGAFEGKLAFVGYGVASADAKYDDFENIDVKDRVVIAMRYEPHDEAGKSRFTHGNFTAAAAIQAKAKLAASHGAKALLIVNAPQHHPKESKLLPWNARAFGQGEGTIPVISIAPEIGQNILGDDHDLAKLQEEIDSTGKPASFLIDSAFVSGNAILNRTKTTGHNVMAILQGKGAHKDEYIVVGAHYDHIGHGDFGSRKRGSKEIFNGADDNASGVCAVLSVAEYFAQVGPQDRSIVFIFFSGEEMMLLGSNAFISDCPIPRDSIVAMVNLDMVGRVKNNMLYVGGDGTAQDFSAIVRDVDAHSPLSIASIGKGGGGPSDHANFSAKKIPVLFFFSGMHAQYHRPEDDVELINYEGLAQVADAAADIVSHLCAMPREAYVDRFDKEGVNVNLSAGTRHPTDPAHMNRSFLGISMEYDHQATGIRGAVLAEVQTGSPAADAGLKPGDVIVKFAGVPVQASDDLTDELSTHQPGETIEIRFQRNGTLNVVNATLAERPKPTTRPQG